MLMLNIPIQDEVTEMYIKELIKNHKEYIFKIEIEEYIKKIVYKKINENIENEFRESIKEVKDIINGTIDRKNVKSLDDLLAELK